jgi:mono/diheme cytochrome c family protein
MDHDGYTARFAMTSVVYEEGKLPGYEGQLISGMALTSRMQASRFVADGSTFRTIDTDALVTTTDRSFRPVDTAVGPDGAIYIADWCDIRMDHTDPRDTWDKSCGRIWRLRETNYRPVAPFNLAARTGQDLIELLADRRKWHREHARRLLGERKEHALVQRLRRVALNERGQLALEALWAANLISGMDDGWTRGLLDHPDPSVRLWTIRLLNEDRRVSRAVAERLVTLARTEPESPVRSELARAAGDLDTPTSLALLRESIRHQEDDNDKHIPLRIWWALEEIITADAGLVLNWVEEADVWRSPLFNRHIAPRIAQRLAAERGDRAAFRRIDPEGDWTEYARYPRNPLPNHKGDYTDWETNYTREISDRNLARLTRFLNMAPAADRDRLLGGSKGAAEAQTDHGQTAFLTYCAPCHQNDGSGMDRLAKPLRNSPWVLGDGELLARIALNGLKGDLLMPPMGALDDQQLAAILTYIRRAWGHEAEAVSSSLVERVRRDSKQRTTPWTPNELAALKKQ